MQIRAIDPINRPFFAGEVSGIDWRKVPTPEQAEAVHRGMDQFGVLVFRDQDIDDEQQVAFSRALGPLESATGDIAKPEERRLSMDVNDISNVDKDNKVVARDDRRRLFGLGNQLWHSDSSFKSAPASPRSRRHGSTDRAIAGRCADGVAPGAGAPAPTSYARRR